MVQALDESDHQKPSNKNLLGFIHWFFIDKSEVIKGFILDGFSCKLIPLIVEKVGWAHVGLFYHYDLIVNQYQSTHKLLFTVKFLSELGIKFKS